MRVTLTGPLRHGFQTHAQAAERELTSHGFSVVQKTPTKLLLTAPGKLRWGSPFHAFSCIVLSQHKEKLHLNAYLHANNSSSLSFLRRYWIELLTFASFSAISFQHQGFTCAAVNELMLFGLVLFFIALTHSQKGQGKNPRTVLKAFLRDIVNTAKLTQPGPRKLRIKTQAKLRCAYCHASLPPSLAVTCPDCHTQVHEECCHEIDSCPTFGCAHTQRFTPSRQRSGLF